MLQDFHHVVHLIVSPDLNFVIFVCNHGCTDKNGVFVVCGDGLLGNFDLSLLQIDDKLEVELKLFLAIDSFGKTRLQIFVLLNNVFLLVLKMRDEVA